MHARMRKVACVVYPFSHVDHEHVPTSGFGACEVQILRIQWGDLGGKRPILGEKGPRGWFAKIPCLPTRVKFSGLVHTTAAIAFAKSR